LCFYCSVAFGQTYSVSGTVLNSINNEPLPSASIFINNSSKGTVSNADGKFLLEGIPVSSFELVISYSGFVTQSVKIGTGNISQPLIIRMAPRTERLEDITIMVPEKDGWKIWGKFFTESFLGLSDFAKECSIENPREIKFFNDKKHNRLKAWSDDNLIITNNALGYKVTYLLENFTYDFKNKITSFSGYAFFTEMKTSSRRKKERWIKARKEAFDGSLMYFMRALYNDSVAAYGFDVREKIRVNDDDSLFSKIYKPGNFPTVRMQDDTYKVVPGPNAPFKNTASYVYLINTKTLSFKDALYIDSATGQRNFYFNNMLQVIYKKGFAKADYLVANGYPKTFKMNQLSDISLIQNDRLIIESDGTYFNPMNLISSGYWGWAHLAEMLPTDYK
jgi:hypothetical protein